MNYDADSLIKTHMQYASSVAKQMRKIIPSLEEEELRAQALLALVTVAKRWPKYCEEYNHNPENIQFFKTYALKRMKGAIIDNLRAEDWVGRTIRTKAKVIQKADQGKGLSYTELSDKTGMPVRDIKKIMTLIAKKPISLENTVGDIETKHQDVEGTASSNSLMKTLVEAVKNCSEEQKTVLALHYFLQMELQEVARVMGLSGHRASKLHTNAIMAIHETVLTAAKEEKHEESDA